jgi:putative membrane protein
MRAAHRSAFALALTSSLALAACGGGADDSANAGNDSAAMAMGGDTANTAAGAVAGTTWNDANTVAFMAAVHNAEIEGGRAATTKATNREVRTFAQMLVTDHTRALNELNQANATSNTGQVPADFQQMAADTKQRLDATARGAEFDRAFVDAQAQNHQAVLDRLNQAGNAQLGNDVDGRVDRMKESVEKHLREAQRLQQSLGGTTAR